jgi:hypothetical protein
VWNAGAEHRYDWTADEVLGRHTLEVARLEMSQEERTRGAPGGSSMSAFLADEGQRSGGFGGAPCRPAPITSERPRKLESRGATLFVAARRLSS